MPGRATVVVGLGFGDCGKGSIVDYLCRGGDRPAVVRFNGGPQAGHNVVTADGRHHTFSQFGSGTLAGCGTFLSRFMLIEPYALLNEAAHLQQLGCGHVWDRLFIDHRCVVVTPAHQAANRLRELHRGPAAHGTCGLGVGEATADAIDRPDLTLRAGDLTDPATVAKKLGQVTEYKLGQLRSVVERLQALEAAAFDIETLSNPSWIDTAVDAALAVAGAARLLTNESAKEFIGKSGPLIFEGAQGVMLDQDHGFHPHTTWSTTTPANALRLLREAGRTELPRTIGVLRTYTTRHGAGPLVTEDDRMRTTLPEPHNSDAAAPGRFRVGVFDAVAARYAATISGVKELAITHLDRLPVLPDFYCNAYVTTAGRTFSDIPPAPNSLLEREKITLGLAGCKPARVGLKANDPETFVATLQEQLRLPVGVLSFGPSAQDKRVAAT